MANYCISLPSSTHADMIDIAYHEGLTFSKFIRRNFERLYPRDGSQPVEHAPTHAARTAGTVGSADAIDPEWISTTDNVATLVSRMTYPDFDNLITTMQDRLDGAIPLDLQYYIISSQFRTKLYLAHQSRYGMAAPTEDAVRSLRQRARRSPTHPTRLGAALKAFDLIRPPLPPIDPEVLTPPASDHPTLRAKLDALAAKLNQPDTDAFVDALLAKAGVTI